MLNEKQQESSSKQTTDYFASSARGLPYRHMPTALQLQQHLNSTKGIQRTHSKHTTLSNKKRGDWKRKKYDSSSSNIFSVPPSFPPADSITWVRRRSSRGYGKKTKPIAVVNNLVFLPFAKEKKAGEETAYNLRSIPPFFPRALRRRQRFKKNTPPPLGAFQPPPPPRRRYPNTVIPLNFLPPPHQATPPPNPPFVLHTGVQRFLVHPPFSPHIPTQPNLHPLCLPPLSLLPSFIVI